MSLFIRRPFRCRSLRRRLILLVSFQILFVFAVIVLHSRDSALTTFKPVGPVKTKKPTEKAEIDMANDYQPWIDFKFVYPEVQPTIQGPRDFYLVVLINSGAKGDDIQTAQSENSRNLGKQEDMRVYKCHEYQQRDGPKVDFSVRPWQSR